MANGHAREFVNRHLYANRVAIVLQAARGLLYLHTRTPTFVHGDPKADNVLILDRGEAQTADFGLSRWAISGTSRGYSKEWCLGGNSRWQAPKLFQTSDDEELQARRTTQSDIFAFGRFITEIYRNFHFPTWPRMWPSFRWRRVQ
ncbi:hypothetical protein BOTBODRAFT_271945 [Botryobasidium botryosum FD-172 SS1]|uniref:Protein kinase domain-containing protein n=1 Tax=Botryobasidium botryosum (strain FD-172 SS1) TaxID=930990 RepID=A0A067M375_BOTB1|nr:hypothetical protein BOTBODRAFT_271945 [Botryobasidium botryosum FD-172 SS1]